MAMDKRSVDADGRSVHDLPAGEICGGTHPRAGRGRRWLKRLGRWGGSIVGRVIAVLLIVMLLPYAARLAQEVLYGAANAVTVSQVLSTRMADSARLETQTVDQEGVIASSVDAALIGTVQHVEISYLYHASIGLDLRKAKVEIDGATVVVRLPAPELLTDSMTVQEIKRDDFWYPLTDKRRQKLIDEETALRRKALEESYMSTQQAWQDAVRALENTFGSWIGSTGVGVSFRFELLETSEIE